MNAEEKRKLKLEKELALTPVCNFLEDYQAELGDGTKKYRGLESGFTEVDDLLGGLDRFILLAGRSGAGKTTLALQLAMGVAEKGTPVIIYSLEMSRDEIITKLLQVISYEQFRYNLLANSVDLRGNDPKLDKNTKEAIKSSMQHLNDVGKLIYVRDSANGVPDILDHEGGRRDKQSLKSIYQDVVDAKATHKVDRVLVLIDSVQDIVKAENAQQTQAEVNALAELTILQQQTGATILATAQKNKASTTSNDDYGDVMGSMSYVHKPNTVVMLDTPREMLKGEGKGGGLTKAQQQTIRDMEKEGEKGGVRPMLLKTIKGRFTGTRAKPLTYYGAFAYFTGGMSDRYGDFYTDCGLIDDEGN